MASNTLTLGREPENQPEIDVSKIVSINRVSFKDKLKSYAKKPFSMAIMLLVMLAALITAGAVVWILLHTLLQGVPHLSLKMFSWTWTRENLSIMPALINTLVIAGLALVIAVPIGVFAAIFMVEYAKSTNIFVKIVRMAAEKYAAGATMDELEEYLTEMRDHTHVYFIVDDLIYLKRGGRISAVTAAFGKLLGIKPLITVMPDGSLQSVGKIKGSKKVFAEFIRLMRENEFDPEKRVEVMQADCPDTGDAFLAALKEAFGQDIKIDYQVVGPVIAAHCGPGTLGLIFYGNKKRNG